jgi:hypothetical protein
MARNARFAWGAVLTIEAVLVPGSIAVAQPIPQDPRPLVVVIEPGAVPQGANEVRAAISRELGVPALALTDPPPPDLILTYPLLRPKRANVLVDENPDHRIGTEIIGRNDSHFTRADASVYTGDPAPEIPKERKSC